MTIERKELKRALLTSIVRSACENGVLDKEDQEMLIRYHMGEITKGDLESFAVGKAGCLEQQMKRRQ